MVCEFCTKDYTELIQYKDKWLCEGCYNNRLANENMKEALLMDEYFEDVRRKKMTVNQQLNEIIFLLKELLKK